ncbi:hypothetical protein HDV01_006123 [Terramyces sp. JEL0728]|nr:hypothetical protein HDV01_006123 [Terramyces sp. JEL0728]
MTFKMEHFPIKLKSKKGRGRFIVAEDDLQPGQVILEEVPTAFVVFKNFAQQYCQVCLSHSKKDNIFGVGKTGDDLITCMGCRKQCYWCSEECKQNDYIHSLACKFIVDLPGIAGAASVDYNLLRLLLNIICQRHLENTTDKIYKQTDYECLQSLVSHQKAFDSKFKGAVQLACQDLQDSFVKYGFETLNVDEMVKLVCRINSNSHAVHDPEGVTNSEIGVGMFPMVAMLNHSCAPNAVFVTGGNGMMVVRVVTPVAEGEEICVSYVDLFAPKWERQGKLLTSKFFWCQCKRCNYQGDSVDPDLYLDGIICPECSNILDQEAGCKRCSKQYGSDYFQKVIADVGVDDAMDLYKAGMIDSALIALLASSKTAERVLHPGHYLLLTIFINLESLYSRLNQFTNSIKYANKAVELMTKIARTSGLGENIPELSNLYEKYSQLLQICSEGTSQGLITADLSSNDLKALAEEARLKCLEIRRVCFGKDSQITLAVAE